MICNSCGASTFLQRIAYNVLNFSLYIDTVISSSKPTCSNSRIPLTQISAEMPASNSNCAIPSLSVWSVRLFVESVTVNDDHYPRAGYGRVVLVHYANI